MAATDRNTPRISIIYILLIIALSAIAYSNTFSATFAFDDFHVIVDNPIIKDLKYFISPSDAQVFTGNFEYPLFTSRYVGYLTFALNFWLHGLDVTGYHIGNLYIHIITALFVYLLVILSFRTPLLKESSLSSYSIHMAAVTSALFALHPLQTQAVTYIFQRVASLAALFYILSLLFYISWRLRNRESSPFKKASLYLMCIISAVLAMKTKETAFTLPMIIVAYEFIFFEGAVKRRLFYLLPILMTMLIIPLNLVALSRPENAMIGELDGATRGNTKLTRPEYLFTSFRVIVTYLRLVFLPVNQNLDYDYPTYHSFFTKEVFLSFSFLLALFLSGAYLFVSYRKRYPQTGLVMFGLLLFFIGLGPESSVVPLNNVIYEHRMYLPSIGIFIILSVALFTATTNTDSRNMKTGFALFIITVILSLTAATYSRNMVWKDELSLWKDVVDKSPNKERGYNNLGMAYYDIDEYDTAIKYFNQAIELDPKSILAYNNRGNVYLIFKKYQEAIADFNKAIELRPDYELYNNRGNVYSKLEENENAIADYNKAIELEAYYTPAYNNRANVYLRFEKYQEAIADFNKAIELSPDSALLYTNRGNAYSKLEEYVNAIIDYNKAIELDPYYASAYTARGKIYIILEKYKRAIADLDWAIELAPDFQSAYSSRGQAYRKLGESARAEKDFQMAERMEKTGK